MGSDIPMEVIDGVFGKNIYQQLGLVVPDFFDNDYVITQMQPKPLEKQPPGYPHAVALHPVVVYSTHSNLGRGMGLEYLNDFEQMLRLDINVFVSPTSIRTPGVHVDEKILEEGPYDCLVAAESKGSREFSKSRIFFSGRGAGSGPPGFPVGVHLDEEDFARAVSRYFIHFAILPQKRGTVREDCYFCKGWDLKTIS